MKALLAFIILSQPVQIPPFVMPIDTSSSGVKECKLPNGEMGVIKRKGQYKSFWWIFPWRFSVIEVCEKDK